MKTNTVVQEAIEKLEARKYKRLSEKGNVNFNDGIDYAIELLKESLPKELEQIEKAFDAGSKYADANCEFDGSTALPNKIQYMKTYNQ